MPVGLLLKSVSSEELSEWQAYERCSGPLGPRYDQEMLRQLHLAIQAVTYTLGAVNTPKGQQNPVREPKLLPGPEQWVTEEDDDGEDH